MIFLVSCVVDSRVLITLLPQQGADNVEHLSQVTLAVRRWCVCRREAGGNLVDICVRRLPARWPAVRRREFGVGGVPVQPIPRS